MAFGKKESYTDDLISYQESIDMILNDLKTMGYKNLTKEKLNEILQKNFSIGSAVRKAIVNILQNDIW
jgi:hypothetical protein